MINPHIVIPYRERLNSELEENLENLNFLLQRSKETHNKKAIEFVQAKIDEVKQILKDRKENGRRIGE